MSGGLSLTPQALKEGERASSLVGSEIKSTLGPLSAETKSIGTLPGFASFIQALQSRYTHKDYAYLKRLLYEDTFPISESFINLALVKEEEQKAKEKELKETKGDSKSDEKSSHSIRDEVLLFYETLHAPKEKIELSELFSPQKGDSKEAPKRLLIEGRAGIGKTTLCQYLASQWAVREREPTNPLKGWPKPFSALIWLPLRRLNEYKDSEVSLPKVVYQECLLEEDQERFSVEDIGTYLKQLEDSHEVLYLLDGYDELDVKEAKNSKEAYRSLLSSLWNKEWCIVTTRPYYVSNNTLWPGEPYRRLENIGFVDENVKAYVKRFFQDFREEKRGESVLQSFERYPMIKGLGHVPILLELICSVWKEKSFEKEAPDTLTHLYQEVTQCLLKRYLQRQQEDVSLLTASEVEEHPLVRGPLSFLEELAWKGMQQQGLIIKSETYSSLIQSHCPLVKDRALFLETVFKHLGFLKGVGEPKSSLMQQEYYFIHLTFQEFFAARYLVNSLKEPSDSKRYQEASQFIRDNKYHPRYLIMIRFTAGLLSLSSKTSKNEIFIHRFWDTLTSEPHDLTGVGHLRLTMACLEEARCDNRIIQCQQLLEEVRGYIEAEIKESGWRINFFGNLLLSYQTQVGVIRHHLIQGIFVNGLRTENKERVLKVLGAIGNVVVTPEVLKGLLVCLGDKGRNVRSSAASVIGEMGNIMATPEVLEGLLTCLSDEAEHVRSSAANALGKMGKSAATPEVMKSLLTCLSDKDGDTRSSAADALGEMGNVASTPEVLKGFLACLSDEEWAVRSSAADALGKMGKSAATSEVIEGLLTCLSDEEWIVRSSAADALEKMRKLGAAIGVGTMENEPVTSEVLQGLLARLSDEEWIVKCGAAYAIGEMREAGATPEVLKGLLTCLRNAGNAEWDVCCNIALALGKMGTAAATPEVLRDLLAYLNDKQFDIRSRAALVLGGMGNAVAIPQVLKALVKCLSDKEKYVRYLAFGAIGNMGTSAATLEVLGGLLTCLSDEDWAIRSSAADTLKKIGNVTKAPGVLQGLLRCLNDGEKHVRTSAASAIGEMGSTVATLEVLRALIECLNKDKSNLEVVWAIAKLNWPASVLAMLEAPFVNLLLRNKDGMITLPTSLSQLIEVYFQTGYKAWAFITAGHAIKKGIVITFNQSGIFIYDSQGSSLIPFPIEIPQEKRVILLTLLIQAFTRLAKKVGLPVRVNDGERDLSLSPSSSLSLTPYEQKDKKPGNSSEDKVDDYFIPDSRLSTGTLLGRGSFGAVYEGIWSGQGHRTKVAVKKLLSEALQASGSTKPKEVEESWELEEFKKEGAVMARLHHPNVVQFYGYCTSPHYALVMEYMSLGSLRSALYSGKNEKLNKEAHERLRLDWKLRYQIMIDIARGLAYLHEKHILHEDLRCANILLGEGFRAKLSDFGLSKIKESIHESTKGGLGGAYAWRAPELLKRGARCTKAADVWSLGMTLFELATFQRPDQDAPTSSQAEEEESGSEDLDSGQDLARPDEIIPAECPKIIATLIQSCWQKDPSQRPTAGAIVGYLESHREVFEKEMREKVGEPPKLSSAPAKASTTFSVGDSKSAKVEEASDEKKDEAKAKEPKSEVNTDRFVSSGGDAALLSRFNAPYLSSPASSLSQRDLKEINIPRDLDKQKPGSQPTSDKGMGL